MSANDRAIFTIDSKRINKEDFYHVDTEAQRKIACGKSERVFCAKWVSHRGFRVLEDIFYSTLNPLQKTRLRRKLEMQ
jgi:hypothetical protein